jgi:hypothetical protein
MRMEVLYGLIDPPGTKLICVCPLKIPCGPCERKKRYLQTEKKSHPPEEVEDYMLRYFPNA